ncbi:DegV family protein [Streptococcus chenjunshii]|uniref:DegV family protein n=1 Tax=Streptococcus chenjunshii TaxID=2173853 RepID=A0A372KN55_9STRE|nr:DegV family protein [Streptococcus chenjunshii]AXQ78840.1 DegV family protein [Streptococcus chenjunshii]RFU51601.1 DegV family protein [Streptococcus chenjunshii]RFU53721.1 DegV family protein [Streptococcus chenjunshii]
MKLAVITDSTAVLSQELTGQEHLYVLNIPIAIDGITYVEGQNLTLSEFYDKMAAASELPKTSQPSLAELDELLSQLASEDYTHVIGLFLAGGISGFWQNIQFLVEEYPNLTIAFPDSKITSGPLGSMVENIFYWQTAGFTFSQILEKLDRQIEGTRAFIMVDDLNHLVKGGRLSNGTAVLGTLLNIKPILHFDETGTIVVYEKVRTEKKAIRRLVELLHELTEEGHYETFIIHAQAQEKADYLQQILLDSGYSKKLKIIAFNGVIATHLGRGAVALGFTPIL